MLKPILWDTLPSAPLSPSVLVVAAEAHLAGGRGGGGRGRRRRRRQRPFRRRTPQHRRFPVGAQSAAQCGATPGRDATGAAAAGVGIAG